MSDKYEMRRGKGEKAGLSISLLLLKSTKKDIKFLTSPYDRQIAISSKDAFTTEEFQIQLRHTLEQKLAIDVLPHHSS